MKVEYLKSFSKDLDAIKSKTLLESLVELIEFLEGIDSIKEIRNIKKLKGFKNAYRIRLGDYRIGFFHEPPRIILARILHRKDIYKQFP